MNIPSASSPAPALPWYRHRWPWFLMLGPGLVVIAGLITAYIAWHGQDGLVVDDYYKEGKAINQNLARDTQAKAWGLTATLQLQPTTNDAPRRFTVTLQTKAPPLAENKPAYTPPQGLRLRLIHPTQAKQDQLIALQYQTHTGEWLGTLPTLGEQHQTTRWIILLEDTEFRWRLQGHWLLSADQPTPSLMLGTP
ncbi:FixH family protein [Parvibium lacunae]|nr:FixH family protein [Parvibium lacunae]